MHHMELLYQRLLYLQILVPSFLSREFEEKDAGCGRLSMFDPDDRLSFIAEPKLLCRINILFCGSSTRTLTLPFCINNELTCHK